MKRFEKCKRVLATLLVALMVLQQTSIITLAEELQVETQTAQEEKAVEQEAKPETSAPETIKQTEAPTEAPKPTEAPTEAPKPTEAPTEAPAPETQAPETQAPETQATEAPATEAPVTEAPATEPQVTEAPVTEPQVTEAPATEPQITEAPETEATEAVTEKKTEEEKESESTTEETEAATKDSFHSIAENVDAKVTLSKGISEDAIFVAKQYGLDSDYVAQNVDAALGAWIEAHNLTVLDAAVYDMHFEEDGKEIAVKQNAKVNLTFNSPILTETGDAGVATDVYVLHVVNGKAKEVGTVTRNGSDAVTAATINTDGFSPFVFVKAVSGDATAQMDDSVTSGSPINDYITKVDIEHSGLPLDRTNGWINGKINFEIPNANKDCASVYIDIPIEYLSLNGDDSGKIRDTSNTEIGDYYLDKNTGRVKLVFKDGWYQNHTNIKGYFNFSASIKTDKLDNKESFEVSFNDKNKFTFKVKPGNIDGWKNQSNFIQDENGDLFIDYEVGIKPDSDLTKFVFTDTLGPNLEYVKDSFTWKDTKDWNTSYPISPNFNSSSATYELDLIKKGEYRINYRVKIKDKTATNELTNTANWTWNGNTEGKTVSTNKTIGKYSISKSGENFTGKTAKWTVKINKGDATTKAEMTNGIYVDTLPNGMLFDKDSLKIKDTVNNRELKDVDYKLDEADGTFTIRFKDANATKVPSYEITYTTSLPEGSSPESGTNYKNSGSFTPDGGGETVKDDGDATYEKDTSNRIKKSVDKNQIAYDEESGDATAKWTIEIDPLGETLENVVVGDNLVQSGNKKNTGILETSIRVVSGDKDVNYTMEKKSSLEGKEGYLTDFEIKLDGKFTEKIYVTYSTTTFADKVNGAQTEIYNNAYVGINNKWKNDQDHFTFEKSVGAMEKKAEKDGTYFKWIVRMNIDPGNSNNAAKDYGENDILTMTDIIPEGMELVTDVAYKVPRIAYDNDGWGDEASPNIYSYNPETSTSNNK